MASDLPPPPSSPTRPPRVTMSGEQPYELHTSDGLVLEALARFPASASRTVVLCHPHPLYGGTMDNAILIAVLRVLREKRDSVATLRFNLRGVPNSQGHYDEGRGELLDVLSALGAAQSELPQASISLLGYSFGAWLALRAAAQEPRIERVGLVAPAVRALSFAGLGLGRSLPIEILVGDSDSFVSVEEARQLGDRLEAKTTVIQGADHNFVRYRRAVAETIVPFLLAERGT